MMSRLMMSVFNSHSPALKALTSLYAAHCTSLSFDRLQPATAALFALMSLTAILYASDLLQPHRHNRAKSRLLADVVPVNIRFGTCFLGYGLTRLCFLPIMSEIDRVNGFRIIFQPRLCKPSAFRFFGKPTQAMMKVALVKN